MRNERSIDQMRPIQITRHFTRHAEGAVLFCMGDTQVVCTASVENGVPRWLKGKNQGWLTAEYGMLPRATHSRTQREAVRGGQTGRSQEISRLIGRSLRNMVDLSKLGERTIYIDCDVLQADGGTRCASISGGAVALYDALHRIGKLDALRGLVAAVSVGKLDGTLLLDLDYQEDSNCATDANIVIDDTGCILEMGATAEGVGGAMPLEELHALANIGIKGALQIIEAQKQAL